jgi:hypothetical protein
MLSERSPIPEVQLAAAVIRRALDDALTPDDRLARAYVAETADGVRRCWTSGVTPRQREDAVCFLLDMSPHWSESRAAWCDAVGLDPNLLIRHALQQLPLAVIPFSIRIAHRLAQPGQPTPIAMPLREAA